MELCVRCIVFSSEVNNSNKLKSPQTDFFSFFHISSLFSFWRVKYMSAQHVCHLPPRVISLRITTVVLFNHKAKSRVGNVLLYRHHELLPAVFNSTGNYFIKDRRLPVVCWALISLHHGWLPSAQSCTNVSSMVATISNPPATLMALHSNAPPWWSITMGPTLCSLWVLVNGLS